MFLESLNLNFIQPCTTDSNRIRIKATPSKKLGELFPYLNTYLKTGIYNSTAKTLTFNYDSKIIILYEEEVAISKLINETDAFETLDYIKSIINNCYELKEDIIPNTQMRKLPSPLELYEFLPKLNCGKCGVTTCLAFATKLINGSFKPKGCLHLKDNQKNKDEIESLFMMLGYEL